MEAGYREDWIPVETSKGMFPTEVAVLIELIDGNIVSIFADKGIIKNVNGQQMLRVNLVKEDQAGKKKRVLLPTETFETATRWIDVSSG